MATPSINRRLIEYWPFLMDEQQEAVLLLIKNFIEETSISNNELNESAAIYDSTNTLFNLLNEEQEKAIIAFLNAAGIDPENGINIDEYNRELDAAMKRMDAGEFYTHEEVVEMLKERFNGK